MTTRRRFLSFMAGSLAAPQLALAQQAPRALALYANVGPELFHYDVDVEAAILTKRGSVKLPAAVQYAWPHETRRVLYVVSSNRTPGSSDHYLTALQLDPTPYSKRHQRAKVEVQNDHLTERERHHEDYDNRD